MNATSTSTSSGWNRGTSTPKPASKKPSSIRGIVAGLVVVALGAGIVAWLFKSGEAESLPLQEKKPARIKEVTPAPAPKAVEKDAGENVARNAVDEKVDDLLKKTASEAQKGTNSSNDVGLEVCRKTKELGITAVDQLVNYAMSSPTDSPPPPMPPITKEMEQNLRKMLKQPIEIKSTDSEEVRAIKQQMINNRAMILSKLDEGYTISDVLMQDHELLTYNANMRRDAMKAMKEFEDAGDDEGAQLYMTKVNEKLQDMGIEPIHGSTPFKDKINKRMKKMEAVNDPKQE